ncbi:MAG: aminotransferase class I/II-fold pyridoxal phosphate-dependent enzyme, partial [Bdellovibrionales bacterium]|nr:aminotransferase class I/II-fold pyridoxal phosphate-dependent enzyme [Bdellovibrionales bacterium]
QAPTPTQWAGLEALQKCDADLTQAVANLRKRRDHAAHVMRDAGLELTTPGGAFYLWPNITKFMGKKFRGNLLKGSSEFCALLLQEEKVAVVPGVEFGLEGYFRLSYVLSEERMTEAAKRIAKFVGEIQ